MWSATGSLHLPRDCKGAAESGNICSSQTLWENGDNCGGNRGFGNRFGPASEDSEGSLREWRDREGTYNRASGRSQEEGRKSSGTEWIQGGGKVMSNMINLPWISHNLTVLDSNDPTLVGLSGSVVNETKKTIIVRTQSREVSLAKDVITFAIDSGDPIIGSRVTQRAEERISRRY